MNFLIKLLNDLSNLNLDKLNDSVKEIDLTNEDDYNDLVSQINEIKNDDTSKCVSAFFGLDEDFYDDVLDLLKKYRKQLIEQNQKKEYQPEVAQVKKSIEDKSEEQPKIKRPSQNINTEAGLQIHKLVQEYVDTMIKPYNPKVGGLTIEQINNSYAALYEYSCWLFNK